MGVKGLEFNMGFVFKLLWSLLGLWGGISDLHEYW